MKIIKECEEESQEQKEIKGIMEKELKDEFDVETEILSTAMAMKESSDKGFFFIIINWFDDNHIMPCSNEDGETTKYETRKDAEVAADKLNGYKQVVPIGR